MPTESISRLGNDNCPEPMVINRNVPSHVSKVIMNGLKLNTSNRIQTITELVVKLFEQPKFNTAEQEPVRPVQRVRKVETKEEVKPAPTVTKSANAKKKKQNKQNCRYRNDNCMCGHRDRLCDSDNCTCNHG